jgi:hypothetical protein
VPASVRQLWTAPTSAPTALVEGPSVIETGADRVAGLDPNTGRERWSYRRGNATLCDATRQDGVVLALFAKSHGCRTWSRSTRPPAAALVPDRRDHHVRAADQRDGTAVVTGGGQIAVDTGGGLNRWTWSGERLHARPGRGRAGLDRDRVPVRRRGAPAGRASRPRSTRRPGWDRCHLTRIRTC